MYYLHIVDTIKSVMSPIKETTFTFQSPTIFENKCLHSVGDRDSSAVPEIELRKLRTSTCTFNCCNN